MKLFTHETTTRTNAPVASGDFISNLFDKITVMTPDAERIDRTPKIFVDISQLTMDKRIILAHKISALMTELTESLRNNESCLDYLAPLLEACELAHALQWHDTAYKLTLVIDYYFPDPEEEIQVSEVINDTMPKGSFLTSYRSACDFSTDKALAANGEPVFFTETEGDTGSISVEALLHDDKMPILQSAA